MEIKDWPSAKHTPALYRELKQMDLLENIAELEAFGYTVLPPEKVGSSDQLDATRDAILRLCSERKNLSVDELIKSFAQGQEHFRFVLWEDPIFEELVLNPAALGLIQWLVGTDCVLSLCNAWIKGEGDMRTDIHADWAQFEMPTMAVEAFGANFNYLLSDYSKEDGCLSFVPGSHRWRRLPSAEEAVYWLDKAEPIEAPAGSMVIWGDHTWHGSYPKQTEGLRLMLLGMYNRPHMQTQEAYRETVTNEALARNPKRFATLMNVYNPMPWGRTLNYGSKSKRSQAPQGYLSLFDKEPAGESCRVFPDEDYHFYDRESGDHTKMLMSTPRKPGAQFADVYKGANTPRKVKSKDIEKPIDK